MSCAGSSSFHRVARSPKSAVTASRWISVGAPSAWFAFGAGPASSEAALIAHLQSPPTGCPAPRTTARACAHPRRPSRRSRTRSPGRCAAVLCSPTPGCPREHARHRAAEQEEADGLTSRWAARSARSDRSSGAYWASGTRGLSVPAVGPAADHPVRARKWPQTRPTWDPRWGFTWGAHWGWALHEHRKNKAYRAH